MPQNHPRGILAHDLPHRSKHDHQEITKLVNEALKPGSYSVDWDGSDFASGVYFFKLQTKDFTETKRMILMK